MFSPRSSSLSWWLGLVLPVVTPGCTETSSHVETRVRVQAGAPEVRDVDVTLRYPVELEADESVAVTPVAISGFLRRVLVDVGDKVRGGQLIAVIDCREYSAQRTQAETSIAKWEAQLDESRSRYERMREMGDKVVAPAEIEAAFKEVRVAEAELADAEAKLSEAGQRQGYCSLSAPFSGYVTERFLDAGAMVSPGGPPIVNIVKTQEVRAVASIVEQDAPKISRGTKVDIVLHAYPDASFEAEVTRLGRSLDPTTRTLRVEMDIPNAADLLLPAMTGRAKLVVGERKNALLVPSSAVLQLEDVAYVYVVREEEGESTARRIEVEIGLDLGEQLEIREGLSATDQVIMVGRELVDDGTPVEPVEVVEGASKLENTKSLPKTDDPVDSDPAEPSAPVPEEEGTSSDDDEGAESGRDTAASGAARAAVDETVDSGSNVEPEAESQSGTEAKSSSKVDTKSKARPGKMPKAETKSNAERGSDQPADEADTEKAEKEPEQGRSQADSGSKGSPGTTKDAAKTASSPSDANGSDDEDSTGS